MNDPARQALRSFLAKALESHGDHRPFTDSDSLFLSGRLDSFTLMNLVMFLEEQHGIDFATLDFEMALLDTVDAIAALVAAQRG